MTKWFVPRMFADQREREKMFDLSENQEQILKVLAAEQHPYEACGYIDGGGEIHDLPNIHCGDRTKNFACDIDDFESVAAIWHSHPSNDNTPSDDDREFMRHLSQFGCKWGYFIVTKTGVFKYELPALATR